MPVDRSSPTKSSSPSKARSSTRIRATPTSAPSNSQKSPSATAIGAAATDAPTIGSASASSAVASSTLRRSQRLSTATTNADDLSDARSESSFSFNSQLSAPVTPATAISAFASYPPSTSRKFIASSPGRSPTSPSSTLAPPHSTPSRVGAGVSASTSSSLNFAPRPIPAKKRNGKGKGKEKAVTDPSPAPIALSSSPSVSASAKGKRKTSSAPQSATLSALTGESSSKRQKTIPKPTGSSNLSSSSASTSPYSLRSRHKTSTTDASLACIPTMTGANSNASDARSLARASSAKPKTSAPKSKRASASSSTRATRSTQPLECSDASGSLGADEDDDVHMSELGGVHGADASKSHTNAPTGIVEQSSDDNVKNNAADLHIDDEHLNDLEHDEDEDHDENDEDDRDDDDEDDHDDQDQDHDGHLLRSSRAAAVLGTFDDEDEDDDDADADADGDVDGDHPDHAGGVFGLNLRAMAGYMSGLSTKFRSLLSSLRNDMNATTQMVALQELSELLSVSTEDTLAGYFPTDSFVKELVYILGGPKPERNDVGGKSAKIRSVDDDLDDEMKAVLAAAAAAADIEDNGEKMLLACRCLANLIEAMPYAAHSVVASGAIPVLNAKLMEITFIDLAEQVLQTLEKISQDYPSSIVKEGGLSAILQYLDFFNIHIQRTAMNAAANCCRRLTPESLTMVRDAMPIVLNVLTYSDQRLVESACKCVVRIVESYRAHPELLEQLLTGQLLAALNNLLLPPSSSTSSNTALGTSVYTDVLKALSTACRSSPRLAVVLLENNIVETLYHLLTGSPAPTDLASGPSTHGVQLESEPASGPDSAAETAAIAVVSDVDADIAGSSVAVADMAVLQNLAQRPKEQIQEALSLVGELLPPLPRDGVFDPRGYTEKAYLKRVAAKKPSTREGNASSAATPLPPSQTDSEQAPSDVAAPAATGSARPASSRSSSTRSKASRTKSEKEVAREAAQGKRVEMLQSRTDLVKRFAHLVLPTLVEVYAASVALHVRHKAINGILKIISFVDPDSLEEALDKVPLASFLAAILSSRDHPTLVNGALQIVELLTEKLPSVYTPLLRREGVMWEIDDIASQKPSARPANVEKSTGTTADTEQSTTAQPYTLSRSGADPSVVDAALDAAGMSLSSSSALARLIAATQGSSQTVLTLDSHGNRVSSSSSSASAFNAQSSTEATDASIWRARVLRDKFSAEASSSDGAQSAAQALDHIKDLVKRLYAAAAEGKETDAQDVLQQVASLFSRSQDPISSFELLRSGLVESLYSFATLSEGDIPLQRRRSLLFASLMDTDAKTGQNGASVLIRRLQEALSRLENVEITTALSGGSDDMRRTPSAMLGRQLRLRLQAEDSTDIPRSCNNIIVTIHAVATFQSLSDYLRPKIAVSLGVSASGSGSGSGPGAAGSSASSRLSSVLAAFAAATGSGGFPELSGGSSSSSGKDAHASSSTDKTAVDEADTEAGSSSRTGDAPAGKAGKCKDNSSGKTEQKQNGASSSSTVGKEQEAEAREQARAVARHLFGEGAFPSAATDADGTANNDGNANIAGDNRRSDEELARSLMEGLLQGAEFDDDEGFTDDEGFDEEILQSEIPSDGAGGAADGLATANQIDIGDKTVNLDVEKEGGKIVAKTPEGTRIATPSHGASTPKAADGVGTGTAASGSSTASPTKPSSYASALQKKPSDWHLEFSIGSEKLSVDTTIYGAVHRFESAQARSQNQSSSANAVSSLYSGSRHIWSNVYTVRYKKVPGASAKPAAEPTPEPASAENASVELPGSIKEDAPYAKLLQLLAVLHSLNMEWREASRAGVNGTGAGINDKTMHTLSATSALAESVFVNNKLTAKLNRQLEEPMIVASACLPAWSTDLPKFFPFLFPFEARFAFLQSTSFGYARLLTRWQALHSRSQEPGSTSSSRLDDSFGFLGRLQRQKVRISRGNLLASAFKVFELYGSNSSVLEVEYFEEVGTGLGPTLEFYSLVSKEFARRDLKLWRDSRAGGSDADGSAYVFSPLGLFPAPLLADDAKDDDSDDAGSVQKRLQAFRILGQFVAKALLDSRIIDCNFSPVFLRAVLNQHVAPTLATLSRVDATLARSLSAMRKMSAGEIESLGLDFTLPGYESIELHACGRDENVTSANVERYISEVLDMTLHKGIRAAVRAFRQGFNLIFPISAMSSFTADELVMLFGNTEEDWSETTLVASVKPDHGLNADSPTFRDIVAIMASFDVDQRREFLQWLTGSPKLPIGGFSGLHPQLTIVKRPHEAPLTPDDYLPSVMTCVNYLKMPNYSSRDKMRERLQTAMKEGSTSFHLS